MSGAVPAGLRPELPVGAAPDDLRCLLGEG
jgi:hypothetical protein